MGLLSTIFGSDKTVDAVGSVVEKTGNALDRLFTSDDERLSHKEILERINAQPAEFAQALNLINASDSSWWNSGWRPALGWVGAASLAMFFIPQYALASFMWAKLSLATGIIQPYPVSAQGLWELVTLLLGGTTLRSIEKANGTAK